MMNFGCSELAIVKGTHITDVARDRAVHAQVILDNAMRVQTFDEATQGCDLVVGFTARLTGLERKYRRNPVDLRDWAPEAVTHPGHIALVFGREDRGLTNEQADRCHVLASIPTDEAYRSMNLAHAVTVALWTLYAERREERVKEYTPATLEQIERANEMFGEMLAHGAYPAHKIEATRTMFRRLLGRARPTTWEASTLMGVFKRVLWSLGVRRTRGPMELPPEERGDLEPFPRKVEDEPDRSPLDPEA